MNQSNEYQTALERVKRDPDFFLKLSPKFKENEYFIEQVLTANDKIKSVLLQLVINDPRYFFKLPAMLRQNNDFIEQVLTANDKIKSVLLQLVINDPHYFFKLPAMLRQNNDFFKQAITRLPQLISLLDDEDDLMGIDRKTILEAIKINYCVLNYLVSTDYVNTSFVWYLSNYDFGQKNVARDALIKRQIDWEKLATLGWVVLPLLLEIVRQVLNHLPLIDPSILVISKILEGCSALPAFLKLSQHAALYNETRKSDPIEKGDSDDTLSVLPNTL